MGEIILGGQPIYTTGLGVAHVAIGGSGQTFPSITDITSVSVAIKAPTGSANVAVFGGMSCWCSAPGGAILHQYVSLDGGGHIETFQFEFNQAGVHEWVGDWTYIFSGITAGTHTFGIAAYDTNVICNFDGNDYATITALELP